jgi:hypothetical protein
MGCSYDDVDYEDDVLKRMKELRVVFDSPYDLLGLIPEGEEHGPGECIQCDAYRRLSKESTL